MPPTAATGLAAGRAKVPVPQLKSLNGPGGRVPHLALLFSHRSQYADQERVLAAAVRAVLREGEQVPMAAIEAGVGVEPSAGAAPPVRPC
jgi:hypothetical protein